MEKKPAITFLCIFVIIIITVLCIALINNYENNRTYDTENESLSNITNINNNENNRTYDTENESLSNTNDIDFMIYDVPHCDGTQPIRCWIENNESFIDNRYYIASTFPNSSIILIQYITSVENK